MNEELVLHDYGYTTGQKIEVEGQMLMAFLNFFNAIVQQETKGVLLYDLPEIKNLKIVDKPVGNALEFLNQPTKKALTILGSNALTYQLALEEIHHQAIKEGKAIKNPKIGKFDA